MDAKTGARVIEIAKGLQGSHYINGGYGATPGQMNGCPCRPGGISLICDQAHLNIPLNLNNRPSNLAVQAAAMTIATKFGVRYSVCAGSYTRTGGRIGSEGEPALTAFLDERKGVPVASWPSTTGQLTPRRAFGPGAKGGDLGGVLIWGESCEGKQHFDCVGFVSYCYWKATGKVIQLEISAWASGIVGKVFDLAVTKPTPMDGDIIIINPHHIGYVCADGTVVQSQDTHIGVTVSSPGAFKPAEWTHLVRLDSLGADWEWPYGWWRVFDTNTYYYFLAPHGIAQYTKTVPFDTHQPPEKAKVHNSGTWQRSLAGQAHHHLEQGRWSARALRRDVQQRYRRLYPDERDLDALRPARRLSAALRAKPVDAVFLISASSSSRVTGTA